jgi:HD-GYP domain-containing protein (c-di-GMP phosphodiesterase class II)
MSGASINTLERASRFLRSLSSATQTYALYPVGHPERRGCAATLAEEANALRDVSGSITVFFHVRDRFYLGRTLLPWESLTLLRLGTEFERRGIWSFELTSGVGEQELDAFVRLLIDEPSTVEELELLAINESSTDEPSGSSAMTELLSSYAMGLEFLRGTASRLLAGQPADMEETQRITETFADRIAADPAQALLLTTVKSHDEYTFHHMVNVCILSIALGHAIGLRRSLVIDLGIGALLHDVGKVKVPREILQHTGPLDEEQWRIVQHHPVDGTGLILQTTRDLYHPAATIVLEHHAAYDASGYPALRGGRQPTLLSRIVSVADCFDAVTSARPYRQPEERRQALALLQAGAGRGFDPRVVRAFVRMMGLYPIGSMVVLSTGETGIVVGNHERWLARPKLRVILDASGSPCEPFDRDLSERTSAGDFRWEARGSIDARTLGIDMLSLLASGELKTDDRSGTGPGLWHEPAPGEAAPEGYVEAHPQPHRA